MGEINNRGGRAVQQHAVDHHIRDGVDDQDALVGHMHTTGSAAGGKEPDEGVDLVAVGADAITRHRAEGRSEYIGKFIATVDDRSVFRDDTHGVARGNQGGDGDIFTGLITDGAVAGEPDGVASGHGDRTGFGQHIDSAHSGTQDAVVLIDVIGSGQGDVAILGEDQFVGGDVLPFPIGFEQEVAIAAIQDGGVHGDRAVDGVDEQVAVGDDDAAEGREIRDGGASVRFDHGDRDRVHQADDEVIGFGDLKGAVTGEGGDAADRGFDAVGVGADATVGREELHFVGDQVDIGVAVIIDRAVDGGQGHRTGEGVHRAD